MLSINMRVFKTVLLLAAFFSNRVKCLPVANETSMVESSSSTPPVQSSSEVDYYDQRQNGTDNYRIHVDGVMFILAPVEALLLAGAGGDKPDLPILDPSKPTSNKPVPAPKSSSQPIKSSNRDASHLVNLLVPFLRRFRQG